MSVHIHPGRPQAARPPEADSVGPYDYSVPDVAIVSEDNTDLHVCRKVLLTGNWILRQYRNAVPCGATHVLLPTTNSQYEVLKYD